MPFLGQPANRVRGTWRAAGRNEAALVDHELTRDRGSWLERAFRPREIFVRVDGRVRYMTLSADVQKLAAAGVGLLAVWLVVATGGFLAQALWLSAKNDDLAEQKLHYMDLLDEVDGYHQRFERLTRDLEHKQTIMLAALEAELEEQTVPSGGAPDGPDNRKSDDRRIASARGALTARLRGFEEELESLAEQNRMLKDHVTEVAAALTLTRAERRRIDIARSDLGRELAAAKESLERSEAERARSAEVLEKERRVLREMRADFAAVSEERDRAYAKQGSLEKKIARFQDDLSGQDAETARLTLQLESQGETLAESDHEIAKLIAERDSLSGSLAERDIRIAELVLDHGELKQVLKRKDAALAAADARYRALSSGWKIQYQALEKARDDLSIKVAKLDDYIANLDQRHADAVSRLTDTAEVASEQLEKTIELTGLSADDLLPRDGDTTARGGPYFHGPEGLTGEAGDSDLAMALGLLDLKLERWNALQSLMSAMPLAPPLEQYEITSHFGKRWDPINGRRAYHYGMDFGAPKRSSVYATAPGKVVYAGWFSQFGRLVKIDHGYGIATRYAHMNDIFVNKGDRVTSGQKIGTVGTTGRSTGPHVHYEVLFNGKPQNPAKFLTAGDQIFKD